MKDFDELTNIEKAALSSTEAARYVRIHAMESGVPLDSQEIEDEEIEPEQEVLLLETKYYGVQFENLSSLGVVFATRADAEDFLRSSYRVVGSKYLGGYHRTQEYTQLPVAAKILEKVLPTEDEVLRAMADLEQQAAVGKRNEKLVREKEERARQLNNMATYVWDQIHAARDVVRRLESVRACWAEYKDLAKDLTSAIACMNRAYPDQKSLLCEALGDNWDSVPPVDADAFDNIEL